MKLSISLLAVLFNVDTIINCQDLVFEKMEEDLIVKISKIIPYPWVNRIDRNIYRQHPEVDPAKLLQRISIAGIAGYWIAKIKGWNRPLFSIAAALPLLLKYLHDEWKLKDLNPAGVIDFKKTPNLSLPRQQSPSKSTQSVSSQGHQLRFKNIRKIPFLQGKIYNAQDFIDKIPESYWK